MNTRRKIVRETLHNFWQSWDLWTNSRLCNIIVIICGEPSVKEFIRVR